MTWDIIKIILISLGILGLGIYHGYRWGMDRGYSDGMYAGMQKYIQVMEAINRARDRDAFGSNQEHNKKTGNGPTDSKQG